MTDLETIVMSHWKPVLWVSGGKDSLVLAHRLSPWAKRIVPIHCRMDDGWPGVTENLSVQLHEWGYQPPVVVRPDLDFDQYVNHYGWPMEVVPTRRDGVFPTPFQREGVKMSSWWWCIFIRVLKPLADATERLGADAFLTASRGRDAPLFRAMGQKVELPVVRYNPMKEWSDQDVWDYVESHGIRLPDVYRWKSTDFEFPDCRRCTARPEFWREMKQHDREAFDRGWPEVRPVYEALEQELDELKVVMPRLLER